METNFFENIMDKKWKDDRGPDWEGLPLFPDQPLSGKNCPETSYEAAEKVKPATIRQEVYGFIKGRPDGATAYEVRLEFRLDKNSTSPRITELKNAGLIVDSGLRRKNNYGNNVVVWRAK